MQGFSVVASISPFSKICHGLFPKVCSPLQVELMPSYYTLGSIGRDKARSRPLYSITEDQKHAAQEFLGVRPYEQC